MTQTIFLSQLPNVALRHIFENLDFLEIQSVRKVCQNLRYYIDNHHKSNSNLKNVSITVENGKFTVTYNFLENQNKLSVVYENWPGGCFVKAEKNGIDRDKYLEKQDSLEIFCHDFHNFWKNQKRELDSFYVEFNGENENSKFLNQFSELLDEHFKIDHFQIGVKTSNQIMPILKKLSPKCIIINNKNENGQHLEIQDLMESNQWKNAERLFIRSFAISASIQKFDHFKKISVFFRTASWDDVFYSKKKFLLDPSKEYFEIKFNISNCGDQLNLLFGPPFVLCGRFRRSRRMWFFRTENSKQVLAIRLYSHSVDLQRMDVATIPQEARIID